MRNRIGRNFYKEETVEIEFDAGDVIEYIEDYATVEELKDIKEALTLVTKNDTLTFEDNGTEGTLVQDMKSELLALAFRKFSLDELEKRLGTKWDLI